MPTGITSAGQIYSVGGAGRVLFLPADAEDLGDAENYCSVSWSGTIETQEVEVSNSCDFNEDTGVTNIRSIIVSARLVGQIMFDHNLDPAKDVLALIGAGSYRHAILEINRGNAAVVGPPAVAATRQAFFNVPEAQMGPIEIGGGGVNEQRRLTFNFKSNGVFDYLNRAFATTLP
jgi:hypothetical protein